MPKSPHSTAHSRAVRCGSVERLVEQRRWGGDESEQPGKADRARDAYIAARPHIGYVSVGSGGAEPGRMEWQMSWGRRRGRPAAMPQSAARSRPSLSAYEVGHVRRLADDCSRDAGFRAGRLASFGSALLHRRLSTSHVCLPVRALAIAEVKFYGGVHHTSTAARIERVDTMSASEDYWTSLGAAA